MWGNLIYEHGVIQRVCARRSCLGDFIDKQFRFSLDFYRSPQRCAEGTLTAVPRLGPMASPFWPSDALAPKGWDF